MPILVKLSGYLDWCEKPEASQGCKLAVGAEGFLARSRRELSALMLPTGYANPLQFFCFFEMLPETPYLKLENHIEFIWYFVPDYNSSLLV